VELARARLALLRPDSAIVAPGDAYLAPVDAMPVTHWRTNRLVDVARSPPRTNPIAPLPAYVRDAWRNADPTPARARLSPAASRGVSR
jgi:hypothetical protein